jgi:phage N-6-adenine-methyltransferase
MSINEGMMSSLSAEWATPQYLFDSLNDQYGPFTLDPCSTDDNAKCTRHFTDTEDGLSQRWTGSVFMNPPYGRQIGKWIRKAYDSVCEGDAEIAVCLIPSRTDTAWWHDYCMKGEVRFIRGRVYFEQEGKTDRAPFPSAIVVFRS